MSHGQVRTQQLSFTKKSYSINYKSIEIRQLTFDLNQVIKDLSLCTPLNMCSIDIPLPEGGVESFQISETPIISDSIAFKYKGIRTFTGRSINQPQNMLKLDYTPNGIHAMVLRAGNDSFFIDPTLKNSNLSSSPIDQVKTLKEIIWHPRVERKTSNINQNSIGNNKTKFNQRDNIFEVDNLLAVPNKSLKTYNLALAATTEYTEYFGGKSQAIASMVTIIHRVNAIYERDLAIKMILNERFDHLVFDDTLNSPYSIASAYPLMSENQAVIDSIIGTENYDLGHLLYVSDKKDGISNIRAVCNPQIKAMGVTGCPHPEDGSFVIDYVAHELGHQFGANHIFMSNCYANPATAVEPGSGSSIMGYAGICSPNVQDHGDPYFNSVNLNEINYYTSNYGSKCATSTPIFVTDPIISLKYKELTIPISTPFVLSAAVKSNDDSIMYCWEQDNIDPNVPTPPRSYFATGPMFRSFPPKLNGDRYFPKLETIISGKDAEWQVLPSVSAKLKFRITARNVSPTGGVTVYDSVYVNTIEDAGPFTLVSVGDSIWNVGDSYEIIWNVAHTDTFPINCSNVTVLLSIDGGKTFPEILNSKTSNTGSVIVTCPGLITSEAFVMIRSIDNVFFTLSEEPIQILDRDNYMESEILDLQEIILNVDDNIYQDYSSLTGVRLGIKTVELSSKLALNTYNSLEGLLGILKVKKEYSIGLGIAYHRQVPINKSQRLQFFYGIGTKGIIGKYSSFGVGLQLGLNAFYKNVNIGMDLHPTYFFIDNIESRPFFGIHFRRVKY